MAYLEDRVADLEKRIDKLEKAAVPAPPKFDFFATFPVLGRFRNDPGDGVSNDGVWWVEQKTLDRVTVVPIGRDGATGLRLHTEPGDTDVSGSGVHERADVALPRETTNAVYGSEQWWAHSILFPGDYVIPPAGGWNVLFNFHDTRNRGGQANFQLFAGMDGLFFQGHAGPTVIGDNNDWGGNQYSYTSTRWPIVRNVWMDFVYHVKWSARADGFFDAWVNGKRKLSHIGPTLYEGYSVFLKLSNYHSAHGKPSSVIHDRIVCGKDYTVSLTSLEGA